MDARGANETFAVLDDVPDLHVSDGANREVTAAFIGKIAMLPFYEPRGMRPNADIAAQILFGQQSGVQTVIEVVAIVGDFVGEVGNLRFERGIFGGETLSLAGLVVSGEIGRESVR